MWSTNSTISGKFEYHDNIVHFNCQFILIAFFFLFVCYLRLLSNHSAAHFVSIESCMIKFEYAFPVLLQSLGIHLFQHIETLTLCFKNGKVLFICFITMFWTLSHYQTINCCVALIHSLQCAIVLIYHLLQSFDITCSAKICICTNQQVSGMFSAGYKPKLYCPYLQLHVLNFGFRVHFGLYPALKVYSTLSSCNIHLL